MYGGPLEPPPPSHHCLAPPWPALFQPQRWLLLGLYKQTTPPPPPSSQLEHKGSIYQYVLVTFRGQCCCSWTQRARSQRHGSVSAALDASLGGMSGVGVRSVRALRWSVPPRVSDTRNWNCCVVLCDSVAFLGRWRCQGGFTRDLFPLAWQWHSTPCLCVMSHWCSRFHPKPVPCSKPWV